MARYGRSYGRDYGWDYGRWSQPGPQLGGMRSDGGGNRYWRDFPGSEGWLGEGYEGMPNAGYDRSYAQGGWERADWMERPYRPGAYGADFRGGYGVDLGSRGGPYGGRARQAAYGGREIGYAEGWDDRRGRIATNQGRGWARTRASELMTPEPEAVTADATIAEVATKMRDLDVGIIPVVDSMDSRRLRGVITDRDIAIRAVADGLDGKAKVADCMTDSVRSVNKNDSVRDVMRIMRQEQVRRVPVTDREGRLVGIIAQADLAVDYAGRDVGREIEVESTIERISEPARPERARTRMAAAGQEQRQPQAREAQQGKGQQRQTQQRETQQQDQTTEASGTRTGQSRGRQTKGT